MTKALTLRQIVSRFPCAACPPPAEEDLRWVLENLNQAPRRCDPHHVTSVGAGGQDVPENLMPLCRRHHDEVEEPGKGMGWMIDRYPGVKAWLEIARRWDVFDRVATKAVAKRKGKR
jgi:hypothetical protein